jgi:hypothetical protein
MINPVQISILQNDGLKRNVIVEPVLEKYGKGLRSTGTFRVYKDAFGDESALFTEPLEPIINSNKLPDNDNPDYLGRLIFKDKLHYNYEGELLSREEQKQIGNYLINVKQPDSETELKN